MVTKKPAVKNKPLKMEIFTNKDVKTLPKNYFIYLTIFR